MWLGGGGTWNGAIEAIRNEYCPVLVWRGAGEGPGNEEPLKRGAHAIDELEVWADEPDDLNADMHYRLARGAVKAGDSTGKIPNAKGRIAAVLANGDWLTPVEVQDLDAEWANEQLSVSPLKLDTVTKNAREMHDSGDIERRKSGQTFEYRMVRHD